MRKRICTISIVLIYSILIFTLTACGQQSKNFTEEEHIQRISELVEKRYMTEDTEYSSFKVFPLYSEDETLNYFLIEFEPFGYLYIKINEKDLNYVGGVGMYTQDSHGIENLWSRYVVEKGTTSYATDKNGNVLGYSDCKWTELDSDGQPVRYIKSHFSIAGILEEKRFLLKNKSAYIPTVKKGDKFLNLVSMQEFELTEINNQASAYITFIAKKYFDL